MDKREQAGWVGTADFDTLDLSVARGNPRFGICAHLYNTGLTPGRCCPANGRAVACKKAPEGAFFWWFAAAYLATTRTISRHLLE